MWSEGFLGRISPLIGYWSFTLFYLMAELFGNVAVGILFWQFANQVIPTSKAKRLYPIYGLWSNLGLIAAGLLGKYAGVKDPEAGASAVGAVVDHDFTSTIQFLCGFVTLAGLTIIASYYWINRNCLDGTANASSGGTKKKKPKLSIGESLKFLMQSKYLGYITILVLAYGITINLVEVSWKDSVKAYFGSNKSDYNSFMSNLYIYTGVSTMVLIIFSALKLYEFCRSWKPDILHVHFRSTSIYARFIEIALSIPFISTLHLSAIPRNGIFKFGTYWGP
jgi:AAA family ATP:ADP antiporter